MTTDEVINLVKQKVGQAVSELGGNAPIYSPEFILDYIKTQNWELEVMGVVTGVEVTTSQIIPDAATSIGLLLAYGAAASIIRDDLLDRLKNGELGISFTSGASAISTNQAGLYLKQSATALDALYNKLLTQYMSKDPNGVLGRDQ
jgi:hypothetical protein